MMQAFSYTPFRITRLAISAITTTREHGKLCRNKYSPKSISRRASCVVYGTDVTEEGTRQLCTTTTHTHRFTVTDSLPSPVLNIVLPIPLADTSYLLMLSSDWSTS